MSYPIQQNTTNYPLVFLLVQSADHISGLTGATPTVTISKNGGSFASPSGAVTEIANGWYKVAGNASDSNTLGPLVLHATAASGDPTDVVYHVVAYNPQDAVHLGLTCLPNTAVTTNASLITSGTGTDQLSVSGGNASVNSNIKKNTARAAFEFVMTDSTSHTPKTGVTVTATRSIDGAAFGACANAVTELSNGVYKIDLAATDLNGNVITLRFTGASSDDQLITIITQP